MEFENDFNPPSIYHFEGDNILNISKFHNVLKNNGSYIYYSHHDNRYYLTGKKLKAIFDNDPMYNLDSYSIHPLDFENIENFLEENTEKKLIDIMDENWSDDYTDPFWKKIM